MVDRISKDRRSRNMSKIRGKNTRPEICVRSALHQMGYRFRLHRKDLPGKPDIVLAKHKVAIMVHGCFWHQHKNCRNATMPKSRVEFWKEKFQKNAARDRQVEQQLKELDWEINTVWECQTKNSESLNVLLKSFFSSRENRKSNAEKTTSRNS